MTCRGRSPRRSPNCSMSKVASAWRHLASSSHQAAANCGPRRLSGSSAENACATAPLRPFEPPARRRPDRPLARAHARRAGPRRPRSSPRARRARSRRPARCGACACRARDAERRATHSAPARVLPAPRPPSSSQVVHGSPPWAKFGGRWWGWAKSSQKQSSVSASGWLRIASHCALISGDEPIKLLRKCSAQFIDAAGNGIIGGLGF